MTPTPISRAQMVAGLLSTSAMLAAGCAPSTQRGSVEMVSVARAEFEALARRRIVFAHQSVGENILDGVRALAGEQEVALNVVETRDPPAGPGLFHFKVGANEAPLEKINDFVAVMSREEMAGVDAAVLKLCYIDFKVGTDAEALARAYSDALLRLQQTRPQTRFIAATAPLTTLPGGPKEWIKSLIGRASPAPQENAQRLVFNRIIRDRFDATHLFDIARLESGETSGGVEYVRADLTDDGGHLNERGRRLAAAAFLRVLAV